MAQSTIILANLRDTLLLQLILGKVHIPNPAVFLEVAP